MKATDIEGSALGCDLDNDGNTDTDDLTALLRHVAKIEPITDAQMLTKADIDNNDTVDAADVTALAKRVRSNR